VDDAGCGELFLIQLEARQFISSTGKGTRKVKRKQMILLKLEGPG